jgi:hypothetical protein
MTVATASATPRDASAQIATVTGRAGSLQLGGRLHSQYSASSIEAADNDFFLRRARLRVDAEITDWISGTVMTDFAAGQADLQDVFVRFELSDAFNVSIGQLKRAFDLFELHSSTDLSLIERTGAIEGLAVCSGVGSICSYSRFTEQLRYAGRDQGVRIEGASGTLSYQVTVTNGTGIGIGDENDLKSFSGRVTLASSEVLRTSAQLAFHDYVGPGDENATAVAWGGDVEYGTWRDGLLVQAGVVFGDNWELLDAEDDPMGFLTLQGVASYYRPLEGDRIVGVEPLARLSYGDPNLDGDDDGGLLFTPGVMAYFSGRNKIGANLDVYSPQTGDTEWSLKVQTFLYF